MTVMVLVTHGIPLKAVRDAPAARSVVAWLTSAYRLVSKKWLAWGGAAPLTYPPIP